MMKKTKKVVLIVIAILILGITSVSAASFKFTAAPNATTAKESETITISLKLSDIDAGELGINTFSAKLSYDQNVFDSVQVVSKNNWSITYNNESGNESYGTLLAVLLSTGVKTDQEIGEIKLRVKEGVKAQKSNISFTSVATNDGSETINESDKTVTIDIKGASTNTNTTTNTIKNTNTTTGSNSSKNQQENISKKPIPQTGDIGTYIFIGIVVIAAIGLIVYIRYQSTKE